MKINQTKLLILSTISLSLFGIWFSANFLPVSTLDTQYTCGEKSKMYLSEDSDANGLSDYWLYLRNNFRLFQEQPLQNYSAWQIYQYDDATNANNTKVFYYSAESDMLRKWDVTISGFYSLDNFTFKRASWVFPINQRVRWIDTNNTRILFQQPTNTWVSNVVSFLYSYKYASANDYGNGTSPYWYNSVASGADFHWLQLADYKDRTSTRRQWTEIKTLDNCKNYELYRCGDGKTQEYDSSRLNQFTWEVCDEWELNWTPWHCNATCTAIGWSDERCWDNITQEAGTFYNGSPETPENMSFETCDDGDIDWDNWDWLINWDDPNQSFCSTQCIPPFIEEFPEIFLNP